jgi:hypothetical protein
VSKLTGAVALLVLSALPCLAQDGHELELWWGGAFRGISSAGNPPEHSRPALGLAWRLPLGSGWGLELAAGRVGGLEMEIEHGTSELDVSWVQVGVVTPPATRGRVSLRAFLRVGASRLDQDDKDCSWWPECQKLHSSAAVANAGLGVRLDVALSRRFALGAHLAALDNGHSSEMDTPSLLTIGLALTARL